MLLFGSILIRTPGHLAASIADAKANNYALGVKLVRGAYHPHEVLAFAQKNTPRSLSISPDAFPPVWTSKTETDACYDECVKMLVGAVEDDIERAQSARGKNRTVPALGVLFGTHNWTSCRLILDELVSRGLAARSEKGEVVVGSEVGERVCLGQLYGMLSLHVLVNRSSGP